MNPDTDEYIQELRTKYYTRKLKYKTGDTFGLRQRNYHCLKCNVQFRTYEPFKIVHFKHRGLNYGVPRPLNMKPECPNCGNREFIIEIRKTRRVEK